MISSRWFILPGPGGLARSHFIHQRLWQYCELLIRRVMLGQEKHSTGKIRTLGTIEALLLIADWHPRALHFPPETEGWDSELISPDYDRRNRIHHQGRVPLIRWREDVFEPAKRSERMSWMLLGLASSLSYELGLYCQSSARSVGAESCEMTRRVYIERLLYNRMTQLATQLGRPTLISENYEFNNMDRIMTDTSVPPRQLYLELWTELTRLARMATSILFQSTDTIKDLVLKDRHAIILEQLDPFFAKWQERFCKVSPSKYLSYYDSE
jgi:hypothetical protein